MEQEQSFWFRALTWVLGVLLVAALIVTAAILSIHTFWLFLPLVVAHVLSGFGTARVENWAEFEDGEPLSTERKIHSGDTTKPGALIINVKSGWQRRRHCMVIWSADPIPDGRKSWTGLPVYRQSPANRLKFAHNDNLVEKPLAEIVPFPSPTRT